MIGHHRGNATIVVGSFLGALINLAPHLAIGGGPLAVTTDGAPVGWSTSASVSYLTDQGGLGLLMNSEAVARTDDLFGTWEEVVTATIAFSRADSTAEDVDETNFGPYLGPFGGAIAPRGENVIVFDADGAIFDTLFGIGTTVLGFADASWLSDGLTTVPSGTPAPPGAEIIEGLVFLNGKFIDGIDAPGNSELPIDVFEAVLVHEFGHFSGLDHTQIHGTAGSPNSDDSSTEPRETMFPFIKDAGQATLERDDVVAISSLYPAAHFATSTGQITGRVLTSGGTPFSGANVIARNLDDDTDAVSWVSGALVDDGAFVIGGLTPLANYRVEVEEIDFFHRDGSSVGPFSSPVVLPGPPEFYSGVSESSLPEIDDPTSFEPIVVTAGATESGVEIVLNEQDFSIENVFVDFGQLQEFALGDFNRDGVLDFVATNAGFAIGNLTRFFRGLGGGVFDTPETIDEFVGNGPIAIGQFNSGVDDFLDIAVASSSEVRAYFGDGMGRFSPPTILLPGPLPAPSSLRGLMAGDFNGDDFTDLVTIESPFGGTSTTFAFMGSASGAFTTIETPLLVEVNTSGFEVGNFAGSGANDLIASKVTPPPIGLWILVGDGAGSFNPTTVDLSSSIVSIYGGFAAGDFDEDGSCDIAISARHVGGPLNFTRSFVQLFLGDSAGGFVFSDRYQVPESFQTGVVATDIDGDSHLDLVSSGAHLGRGHPGAKVNIAFGDGSGILSAAKTVWGLAEFPSNLAASDLDGDGDTDLLVNLSRSTASGTFPDSSYAVLRAVPEPDPFLALVCGATMIGLLTRRQRDLGALE